IPMLSAASGTAYSQPNRIAAVTMKTDAIETSDLPFSSIGTGLRSATSESAKNSRTMSAFDHVGASKPIRTSDATANGSATAAVAAMYAKSRVGRPRMVDTRLFSVGERGQGRRGRRAVVL